MVTSILIPRRPDNGHRDRLWAHTKQLWADTSYEICEGTDTGVGPFNIAMAFNNAKTKATGDKAILYGADHLPNIDRIEWATNQLDTHPWVGLYAATGTYNPDDTQAILTGEPPNNYQLGNIHPFCIAIIGIRADMWIPLDERFTGWGSEDTAWRLALTTLYGEPPTPTSTLQCLHHPPAPRDQAEHNYELLLEYQTAAGTDTMRAYLQKVGVTNHGHV